MSLHLLARFLKGGDHLLAGLPSEYKEAYLAAERIIDRIGWLHMMSWMGNRNHSHILVQWLGELRAWTCIGPDSLGNKIRCVEAGVDPKCDRHGFGHEVADGELDLLRGELRIERFAGRE